MVHYLCGAYRVSQRHACRTAQVAESTLRYRSRREPRTALRLRIREIAQVRIGYGYRKIRVLLKREGWQVGKKLVYRLYREEGLTLRYKPRRRRCAATNRRERCKPVAPNEVWSLDFVADQLADGRRFRALTVVDVFTRESLAIEVGQSLKGEDVVRVLSRIGLQRAVPKTLFCDNGTEFTLRRWTCGRIMRECASIFHGRGSRPTTPTWNRSTARCGPSVWMRTGSHRWRRRSTSSRPGDENTMRVVLTELTERGRHTKSLVNSRLAANSQASKLPETHSRDDAEKGNRSKDAKIMYASARNEVAGQEQLRKLFNAVLLKREEQGRRVSM